MKLCWISARKATVFANPDNPEEPGFGTTEDVEVWALYLTFGDEAKPREMRQLGVFLAEKSWDATGVADMLEQAAQKIRATLAEVG